jgi:enamine deaminase RidA (YjgF/YER057c/UK114 family)
MKNIFTFKVLNLNSSLTDVKEENEKLANELNEKLNERSGQINELFQRFKNSIEDDLIKAGSSMEKVLKVNVYLNDFADYKGMNEVYKGRFGSKPPARTTVAVAKGGIPGDSIVEMDVIAYI